MVNAGVSSVLQRFVYSTLSFKCLKSIDRWTGAKAELLIPAIYILTPALTLILLHSYIYVPVFVTIIILGAQARNFGVILDSFLSVTLYWLHLQILSDAPSKYICIIFRMNCFNFFLTDLDCFCPTPAILH